MYEGRRRLLQWGPIMLVLGLLFTWGAAESVRKPLALLTRAAERIAAGDLGEPIPALPSDEIGRLGAAFEAMRAQLPPRSTTSPLPISSSRRVWPPAPASCRTAIASCS